MKTKILISTLLVITLAGGLAGLTGTASAASMCNPDFVAQTGNKFTVTPTGVDDTANIQCAFDAAVAYGQGAEVHLAAGDFRTAQIVVNDFDGAFTGEGPDETVIMNLPNLYVTPVEFYVEPPSANNPWPSLIAFVDGKIAISNLAIRIVGNQLTTGWSVYGLPPINEFSNIIALVGEEMHASVENFLLEGEASDEFAYGYNSINGFVFGGLIGELPSPPASGSFEVYNSTFRHFSSPIIIGGLDSATAVVSHNYFEDVFDTTDVVDIANTSITVTHNHVNGSTVGFWLYPWITGNHDSTLLIKNNTYRSQIGVLMEAEWGADNDCLLMGNNLQNADIGAILGAGVTGCTVIGGNNKTNIIDLGVGNTLVGVNNMGTGIGPEIQSLMNKK